MASNSSSRLGRALLHGVVVACSAFAVFLVGCGARCASETMQHLEQDVFVSPCTGRAAVRACTEAGGYGGLDRVGDPVPGDALSAATAICIAASEGMKPALSQYHAIWDPNRNGSRVWSVQMILREHCKAPDLAGGHAATWQVDADSGEILSHGYESYTAVRCVYGTLPTEGP
jgi:hypothetical protein